MNMPIPSRHHLSLSLSLSLSLPPSLSPLYSPGLPSNPPSGPSRAVHACHGPKWQMQAAQHAMTDSRHSRRVKSPETSPPFSPWCHSQSQRAFSRTVARLELPLGAKKRENQFSFIRENSISDLKNAQLEESAPTGVCPRDSTR